ncbi:MAG: P83/100 family protein [Treponemataceae bacterium]
MKRILILALSLIFSFSLFGLEVDKDEVKQDGDTIEFINYTGTHTQVDTVEEIRGIGTNLGSAVKNGTAGNQGLYYVMHIVDTVETKGFDADILILGPRAKVDHINNLRLIIAGYLQSAYKYSAKDASTLAHFITIYNAVYRGNTEYFSSKYKETVTKNLTKDKAGLATHYKEWAGKTQILIPLSDPRFADTISAIDTEAISDKTVVEKMREEKDKDIPTREDMIDLKERESEAAKKRAEEAQKEATEAQKKADATKKQADAAKKEADTTKKDASIAKKEADKKAAEAEQAKKKADTTKSEQDKAEAEKKAAEAEKAKQDAEKAEQEADKAKQEADKKAAEAEKAKKTVDEKKKDAEAERKQADKKEKEAQDDRKNVAADTQKILEEKANEKKAESSAAIASAVPGYGLRVVDKTKMLSQLVLLDLKTAKELKASAVNTIHGRCLLNTDGRLMAIAGTTEGGGVVTLVLFDPITLEVVKQGADNIATESVLIKNEEDYYAIVDVSGKYYVGRFDKDLKLQAKSSLQVLPYSPVTIMEEGIMVQASDDTIRLIGLRDLIEKTE